MFCIDHTANRITKLKEVRFSELGFNERGHLQEQLANQPNALGEDLLVIQKEFEARRLIEKHGYWRRKEELEDAERFSRDAKI